MKETDFLKMEDPSYYKELMQFNSVLFPEKIKKTYVDGKCLLYGIGPVIDCEDCSGDNSCPGFIFEDKRTDIEKKLDYNERCIWDCEVITEISKDPDKIANAFVELIGRYIKREQLQAVRKSA